MDMLFLECNDEIFKLEILFDKEKLKTVRDEIYFNCSKVTSVKKEKKFTNSWNLNRGFRSKNYQNYKCHIITSPEIDEDLVHRRVLQAGEALISYDYYEYPEIVDKLDETIKCQKQEFITKWSNLLLYLSNLEEKNQTILENQIKIKNLEDLYNTKNLYKELEEYFKVLPYLNIIENMIDFNIIESYSKQDLENFQNFFDQALNIDIKNINDLPSNIINTLKEKLEQITKQNNNIKDKILVK